MAIQRRSARKAEIMADAPAIKILLYVDSEELMVGENDGPNTLIEALKVGTPAVEFAVRSRTEGERLTAKLLEPFDEAWFFLKEVEGDDLDSDEVEALRKWMDRGRGVLVAGDHTARRERGRMGLGAGVGESIPRAGEMRLWDEGPSLDGPDAIDTIDDALDLAPEERTLRLEQDPKPQRMLLPRVDGDKPHPIFRDGHGRRLDRFPDHMHEGEVKVEFDGTRPEWAEVTQASGPQVVARGVDWRHGRDFALMAVWDGHTSSIPRGRIVADSSFHHYVNDNVECIAAADGEDWRQIRTLYRNIVAWLAPPGVKQAYVERALTWLARQELLADVGDDGNMGLGRMALHMLADVLPGAWLHELVDDVAVERGLPRLSPAVRSEFAPYLLGACMRERMQVVRGDDAKRRRKARLDGPRTEPPRTDPVSEALDDYARALKVKQDELGRLAAALQRSDEPG